jgi:hypothetical protein
MGTAGRLAAAMLARSSPTLDIDVMNLDEICIRGWVETPGFMPTVPAISTMRSRIHHQKLALMGSVARRRAVRPASVAARTTREHGTPAIVILKEF